MSSIMSRLTTIKTSFLLAVLVLSSVGQTVNALEPGDYARQDIIHYDKSDVLCSASSASTVSGQVSSSDIVTAAAAGAEKYRADYESAGQSAGVPWQLLAAIHYRETNYGNINPANGQGLFQFFAEAGSGKYPPGEVSRANFLDQLNYLAGKLKNDYATRGYPALAGVEITDARKIKDIGFSYNGRAGVYATQAGKLGFDAATEGYEGSPYVMNFFDAKRDPQKAAQGTWGQILTDNGGISYPANNQVGLFTLYAKLGGGTSTNNASGSGCKGANNGVGGGSVIDIAKQELEKATSGCMSDASSGQCKAYTDGNAEAWCADFVSWVYNQAKKPFTTGESGGWRIPSVYALDDYLAAKQIHFLRSDMAQTPQPGDIIIMNDGGPRMHTGLVYTVNGDSITTIEGNISDKVASRTFDNYRTNENIYAFGRMK
jgi:hypothetical protein